MLIFFNFFSPDVQIVLMFTWSIPELLLMQVNNISFINHSFLEIGKKYSLKMFKKK